MNYWVTFKIKGRFVASVDAESVEEAVKKAQDEYIDADFGALEEIEGEPVIVEDEVGAIKDVVL